MIAVFAAAYPDVEFINAAVAGGAGTNAKAVLASRLAAGDPPDSWQAHAGQEILGAYVAADQIEPLDALFAEEGWTAVMPATLLPLISKDGKPFSVPVNIHRANVMWTNPAVLAEVGVTVPTTWDEFFAACDKIEASGRICLSMGETWTAQHLMEVVLLGALGADKYNALWDGTGDWGSADVTAALETYAKVLGRTQLRRSLPHLAGCLAAGRQWRRRLQHHGRLGATATSPAPRPAGTWASSRVKATAGHRLRVRTACSSS